MSSSEFSQEEQRRYQRHFTLPGFGAEGQKKLKHSSVLLIGAGGLGSAAAFYLVAAGIGRLGLIDHDHVDLSNLQRQILFGVGDIGKAKVQAASEKLAALNPHVNLIAYEERLTPENAIRLFRDYDLILDGSDNFATRYLVNDAALLSGKPYLYASIREFSGQLTLLASKDGPCYRCLFPEQPAAALIPDCSTGGVLGVLPGIVGSMQAMEAIKYLTSVGDSLSGKILLFDALHSELKSLQLAKDPLCPSCNGGLEGGLPASYEPSELVPVVMIDPAGLRVMQEAKQNQEADFLLLDVREPFEHEMMNLSGALIPLAQLQQRLSEIFAWQDKPVVVYCQSGRRSEQAARVLLGAGFSRVMNLRGGLEHWCQSV